MKEKYIAKASVFFAVLGLGLMYASSIYINIEEVDIGNIEKSWAGKNVKISGEVVKSSKSSGHLFLNINDSTGGILVVNFDSEKELSKGNNVNVTGHVEIYEGKLEIIARKIKKS